jgi:hypothetical protein
MLSSNRVDVLVAMHVATDKQVSVWKRDSPVSSARCVFTFVAINKEFDRLIAERRRLLEQNN